MNIKIIINSLGIILNIIGVYLVFVNSPVNFDVINGGDAFTDWEKKGRETNRRNNGLKYGVYIVLIGSVLQLVSNFIE